jgi:ribosomal protein L37AE/L43A
MPFDPNVTFQDAEQARAQKLSIGKQRRIPQFLGILDQAAKSKTFYIHSVGPWPESINTGSTGWFNVPGCPKNKDYVTCPRDIPGIVSELTIKDEYEYNRLMDDGWRFACEVVGDGRGRDPEQSYRHYGLFCSENAVPTKAETSEAREKWLFPKCAEIVREARDLYAMDRKLFSQIVKRERHFTAAEVLNLNDEVWMIEQTPSNRTKCPVCQKMNEEGTMKCGHCGEIIDAVAYRRFKDNQEQILTEPKKTK